MRDSSFSSFEHDCPTAMATPLAGQSTDDLGISNATAKIPARGPGNFNKHEPSSSLSVLAGQLEKGKGKATTPSTKTASTAVFEGEGTKESPYIVDWTENDPENPMRWVSPVFHSRQCLKNILYGYLLFDHLSNLNSASLISTSQRSL